MLFSIVTVSDCSVRVPGSFIPVLHNDPDSLLILFVSLIETKTC